jgi:dTDP-4-amino-4,6-dideoxygalactose transaminase
MTWRFSSRPSLLSFWEEEVLDLQVPFVDLKIQFRQIRDQVLSSVESICSKGAFVSGADIEDFEREFASFCGTKFCVALNSGSSSLHVGLKALRLQPGAKIIVPALTFIATAAMVTLSGGFPFFADVDPKTFCLDPIKVEELLNSQLRTPSSKINAIIPVHLYGQSADMDRFVELSEKYRIPIIEDCSQAHGAKWNGRKVGGFGQVGCFSFYPAKNLGAYGEAGALITNDHNIFEFARSMRDHGSSQKYWHLFEGHNYRMDTLQAAILRIKLQRLEDWTAQRRIAAGWYRELLSDLEEIHLPVEANGRWHVYHLFVILTSHREKLRSYLSEKGIGTGIHYCVPLHLQPAYHHLGLKEGTFPVAESIARECLSLPMYPELTREQVEYVCREIKSFFSKKPN